MNNLPKVLTDLVNAQNNYDSIAFADCFADTAVVFDEGKTHKGRGDIKNWIEKANETYKTVMKPIDYSSTKQTLKAEISGSFPGSPLVLTYQFEIKDEKVLSLKIVYMRLLIDIDDNCCFSIVNNTSNKL